MRQTDQMLARYAGELEERQAFIDGIVEDAETSNRDLNAQEMELVGRARDRIQTINGLVAPLAESSRIAQESRDRMRELAPLLTPEPAQRPVEYRSAGAYVLDIWRAGLGQDGARSRLDVYHRAAAHQTTADNPGLLPEQILGPVVNFVDVARPLINALGPRQLPSGSWSRPKVTQHTAVAGQSPEKTELVSQKMVIGKLPVSASTYGGYVNVSRQDIPVEVRAIGHVELPGDRLEDFGRGREPREREHLRLRVRRPLVDVRAARGRRQREVQRRGRVEDGRHGAGCRERRSPAEERRGEHEVPPLAQHSDRARHGHGARGARRAAHGLHTRSLRTPLGAELTLPG